MKCRRDCAKYCFKKASGSSCALAMWPPRPAGAWAGCGGGLATAGTAGTGGTAGAGDVSSAPRGGRSAWAGGPCSRATMFRPWRLPSPSGAYSASDSRRPSRMHAATHSLVT